MCSKGLLSDNGLHCCAARCTTCGDRQGGECGQQGEGRSCNYMQAPCSMLAIQRVTVAYTSEVARVNSNIQGQIKLAIAETNAGYQVSNVPIKLVLADVFQSDVVDTGDSYQMLMKFRGTDRKTGNIAVLLSQSLSSCGRGTCFVRTMKK